VTHRGAMHASLRSGPPGMFTMAGPGVHDDRNPHPLLGQLLPAIV